MSIYFVTSNQAKFEEAKTIAKEFGINLLWYNLKYDEIQGKTLEEIAEKSAILLSKKINKNFFIEDSGLFIEALNGFPGPYSSYVFKTIGNDGILRLMKDIENRKAYFIAVIAFYDGNKIRLFKGKVEGEISNEKRGKGGFGFDPIFLYKGKTFAEMGREKNRVSHRRKALEKLFSWLVSWIDLQSNFTKSR